MLNHWARPLKHFSGLHTISPHFNIQHACILSCFSCVQLFVALWTVACQAPLSMWSPLPHWSGLPCPPLGDLPDSGCISYISCIGRWVLYHLKMKVKVTQSCPTLWNPMNYTVHEILQARILELVAFPFSRGSSQPRGQPRSLLCRWILYQISHKGSPRILWVGSLSLLQQIFLSQESNWGLLHCRWILCQPSCLPPRKPQIYVLLFCSQKHDHNSLSLS